MKDKLGKISVHSENIFPIIRQWLYSEQEIFLRELISNAADALSKRHFIEGDLKGGHTSDILQIKVHLDTDRGTLTISDNGIGMTADEVEKYINHIAYSGLLDFVEKYKSAHDDNHRVIGHFGLGFYSAFMVSDKVVIETKSCQPDSESVHWESEEGLEFRMSQSEKKDIGTDIILKLNQESAAKFDQSAVENLIRKYCGFMSWPVLFSCDSGEAVQCNDTSPLWKRRPADCLSEEYVSFYHKHFENHSDPLFWIHLNLDYPLRLKGILYFPNENRAFAGREGRIRVYSQQVFVSDNMREMIPDFLFLLQGFLDCPDLPLNVSRSYLQSDDTVKKLSAHIVKKVADEVSGLYKNDLERYKGIWPSIEEFVKIGCLQDEKFARKILDIIQLQKLDGEWSSFGELPPGDILYTDSKDHLELYAGIHAKEGKEVYILDHDYDIHWMGLAEYLSEGKRRFVRVDTMLSGQKDEQADTADFQRVFRDISHEDLLKLESRHLGDDSIPAVIKEDEELSRIKELQKIYQNSGLSGEEIDKLLQQMDKGRTLILNSDNPLIKKLSGQLRDHSENSEIQRIVQHIWDLALLSKGELKGPSLIRFMQESQHFLIREIEAEENK